MYDITDLEVVLQNHERRYTVAVYYRRRRLYYIALLSTVAAQYVSARIGGVMDMCVGYFSSPNRNMIVFDANSPLHTMSDDDAGREN